MEQINEIVNAVIGKLASRSLAPNQQIYRAWQDVIGKKHIKHTSIEGVKNGRLLVKIDSPALIFHLNLKRNRILKELQKINEELTDIDLRIGKVR